MGSRQINWTLVLVEVVAGLGAIGLVALRVYGCDELVVQEATVTELANDPDLAKKNRVAVSGSACGIEPFPLGMGDDQDNVRLCITDGAFQLQAMGDRADWSFVPGEGERVEATVVWAKYMGADSMFLLRELQPGE